MKTGNTYKFGEQYLLDANAVKGDSLVLRSTEGDDGNLMVYRRLPRVKEYAKWNPVNKKYSFKNWKSETVVMDFITTSTLNEQQKGSDLKTRKWESIHLNDYAIFLFTYIAPTPILIDSVTTDKVYATYYGRMPKKYVFEEIKK